MEADLDNDELPNLMQSMMQSMAEQSRLIKRPDRSPAAKAPQPAAREPPEIPETGRSPTSRTGSGVGGAALAANIGKGAISQLQEFVQGARAFPMPPSCPVLHWCHDTRIVETCLEFRATVSFLLDGVPHHIVGAWKPSKKQAQRDASERALGLFVGHWGDFVGLHNSSADENKSRVVHGADAEALAPMQALEHYCSNRAPPPNSPPRWSHVINDGEYQAFVEVVLFGIPHTFPGKCFKTQDAAYHDTARRVLWYLQQPGYEDAFEPDKQFAKETAHEIPEPAPFWAKEAVHSIGDEEQVLAERKTTVMRVQNRLQQAYARKLEAGTSVWTWSYERDTRDKTWPPTFRATAHVPLAGRLFVGDWVKTQREAQINACSKIMEFLDAEFPR